MPEPANEALKKVDVRELQIGMYVIMPVSWKSHPFLVNKFRISSPSQIQKIIEAGLKDVMVDVARSKIAGMWPIDPPGKGDDSDKSGDPNEVHHEAAQAAVLEKIREAVCDKKLQMEDKTRIVYTHSVEMINGVLDRPTTKNIGEAKGAIVGVVDMILSEKETSHYLARITSHDFYTYTHSVNVGFLAVCLAKTVFQDSETHDMHELGAGFFLHDLGKVRILPEIITKPGRLSEEEMTEMRKHPSLGYKILHETRQLTEECKTIVLQHHERIDGTGYPKRLRGEEIHIYGRICSIADVYDALTSDRPYRQKTRPFDALQLMKNEMINHFHKDLFEKFILMLT
jgi:HD-GYP domain-containing protein (c-di-GMP phosphodiesterase class II)